MPAIIKFLVWSWQPGYCPLKLLHILLRILQPGKEAPAGRVQPLYVRSVQEPAAKQQLWRKDIRRRAELRPQRVDETQALRGRHCHALRELVLGEQVPGVEVVHWVEVDQIRAARVGHLVLQLLQVRVALDLAHTGDHADLVAPAGGRL